MERLDSLRVAHDGVAGKIAQATVRVKLGAHSLGVLHEYDHSLSVSHPEDSSPTLAHLQGKCHLSPRRTLRLLKDLSRGTCKDVQHYISQTRRSLLGVQDKSGFRRVPRRATARGRGRGGTRAREDHTG